MWNREFITNFLIARHKIIYDLVTFIHINICHAEVWLALLINAAAAFYSCFAFIIQMTMSLSTIAYNIDMENPIHILIQYIH